MINVKSLETSAPVSVGEVVVWLQAHVAGILGIPARDVGPDVSLDKLGVDSATAVSLSYDVECFIRRDVDASLFLDHRSIKKAANYLLLRNSVTK